MKKIYLILFILMIFLMSSCQDWVENIEPTNDKITDEQTNKQETIELFITGLYNALSESYGLGAPATGTYYGVDEVFLCADGLSDEMYFDTDKLPGSTYSTYMELDKAAILEDNADVSTCFNTICHIRMLADTLVYKTLNLITFTNDETGEDLKNRALFNGNLFGGYARYLLASYFGKDITTGGGVINKSGFISSGDLYKLAIQKLTESLKYTTDAAQIRLVNSLIARCYLMMKDYANASTFALKGMISGDDPFVSSYNDENENLYRTFAGEYRVQFALDNRFNTYITKDPDEAKRILLSKKTNKGYVYYRQEEYIQATHNPIKLICWQENNLMKAELTLRGNASGNAVALINEVRESHGMKTLRSDTTVTLSTDGTLNIFEERDKELYVRGMRLLDQRRFGKFHITDGWQYFPIPRDEKVRNPNLNF
jgi:starch-binding outer membrane protein, SusD/RagB family